ncbi:MAG: hypothetical protein LBC18_14305 [Opitutaceae bacterium]|jgi:hypothetical protein|nr:hypothetical protein [Opitutaceae bacterium]
MSGMEELRAGMDAPVHEGGGVRAGVALSERLDGIEGLLRAVLERLPAAAAPVPAEKHLKTGEAKAVMGYSDAHSFVCAARAAGVFPVGNARPFRWRPADLARWQAAPKRPLSWGGAHLISASSVPFGEREGHQFGIGTRPVKVTDNKNTKKRPRRGGRGRTTQ